MWFFFLSGTGCLSWFTLPECSFPPPPPTHILPAFFDALEDSLQDGLTKIDSALLCIPSLFPGWLQGHISCPILGGDDTRASLPSWLTTSLQKLANILEVFNNQYWEEFMDKWKWMHMWMDMWVEISSISLNKTPFLSRWAPKIILSLL